jgi:hypothetical protein
MNPRELRLLIILGVIVLFGGGGIGVYQWFYKPFMEYGATIARLDKANREKRELKEETYKEIQNLERLRVMSLSPNAEIAESEYESYLLSTLRDKCKLEFDKRQGVISEVKGAGSGAPGAVKPGHKILSYDIRIPKTDLRNVVHALKLIQHTPLVQRIKSLTIERVDTTAKNTTDKVKVQMTLESLIISRAETRLGGPLAIDQRLIALETMAVLERGPVGLGLLPWYFGPTGPFVHQYASLENPYREYGHISLRNIFVGPVPAPRTVEKDWTPPKANFNILEYVRLDHTDPVSKEAFFRNMVFPIRPIRVKPYAGFEKVNVKDEFNTEDVLRFKVLRIDQRDVYFQVRDEIYRIHIGQSLADAMGSWDYPRLLSEAQIEAYGLGPLFDVKYAADEEAQRSKESSAKKKKGKGG